MAKNNRNEDRVTVPSSRRSQHLVAENADRAPGKRHTVAHNMGTEDLHVTDSIQGFGRIRFLSWTETDLTYEIEGNPKRVSFHLALIEDA